VRSRTTPRFRTLLEALPDTARSQARNAYRLFRDNPHHPSLHFRRVHEDNPTHLARIGLHCRALGYFEGDTFIWVWIGTRAEYDRLLARR
jgi:hypothetical protein